MKKDLIASLAVILLVVISFIWFAISGGRSPFAGQMNQAKAETIHETTYHTVITAVKPTTKPAEGETASDMAESADSEASGSESGLTETSAENAEPEGAQSAENAAETTAAEANSQESSAGAAAESETVIAESNISETPAAAETTVNAETTAAAGSTAMETTPAETAATESSTAETTAQAPADASTARFTFSVLGDSISSFEGISSDSGKNFSYYPSMAASKSNDCQTVEDMWFSVLEREAGAKMLVNNSASGSLVTFGETNTYRRSFQKRIDGLDKLGKPDYIFVFGGINDYWKHVELYTDSNSLIPSLNTLFRSLKTKYPRSKIVYLIYDEFPKEWKDTISASCSESGVQVIKLPGVSMVSQHPDKAGMETIGKYLAGQF